MLFVAQFVSGGFLSEGLVAIFRQSGMPLDKLGLLYFVFIFWSIRFFWSPFVDKVLLKFGVYKYFILSVQGLMILTLVVVSFLDIKKDIFYIVLFSGFIHFLAATQDIASSAFLHKVFKYGELSYANTIKSSGNLVGYILGCGVTLIIYDKFGLKISMLFLISLIFLAMILVFKFNEEKTKINLNNSFSYKSMFIFVKDEKIWISVMILVAFGICMSYGLLTPILVDNGWELNEIGELNIYGTIFAIFGSLFISYFLKKLKLLNSLLIMTLLLSLIILSMLLPINGYTSKFIVIFVVFIMYGAFIQNNIIISTIIMSKAKVNPASQIAIQSSISMFFQFVSFYAGMALSSFLGYKFVVILSSILCVATFIYILLVRKWVV